MPVAFEGQLVRRHIELNFLLQLSGILDISFRTGRDIIMYPNGQAATYLVNPAVHSDKPILLMSGPEVDNVLVPGTDAYDQLKVFFKHSPGDGCVLYAKELTATPDPSEIATASAELDNAMDAQDGTVGLGWPYLVFTNLDDPLFLSEATNYYDAQENIFFGRVERITDIDAMAANAAAQAANWNSKRAVLAMHAGIDADLDGTIDTDIYIDAAAAGHIAGKPVGGWEIFGKNTLEGHNPMNFTQLSVAQNGLAGTPGAIVAGIGFGKPAFSYNKTSSGDFIDVTQMQDFMGFKWRQAIWVRHTNLNKIPYTLLGQLELDAAFEEVLIANAESKATRVGIVARDANGDADYTVTHPDIAKISLADRLNRNMRYWEILFRYTASVLNVGANIVPFV